MCTSYSSRSTTQHKLEPWAYKYSMPSDVAHKNKQLYVDSNNNKKTKCIKIHTDLEKPDEMAGIIPMDNN